MQIRQNITLVAPKQRYSKHVKIFFKRYAPVFVFIIFVKVNQLIHHVHGLACAGFKFFSAQEIANEHGREDVARAGEMNGNLGVGLCEILAVDVIIAYNRRLTSTGMLVISADFVPNFNRPSSRRRAPSAVTPAALYWLSVR